jgi:hypothetical protein
MGKQASNTENNLNLGYSFVCRGRSEGNDENTEYFLWFNIHFFFIK